MVGDKISDVETGWLAICKTVLLNERNCGGVATEAFQATDFVAPSLLEAVRWVINSTRLEQLPTGLLVTG